MATDPKAGIVLGKADRQIVVAALELALASAERASKNGKTPRIRAAYEEEYAIIQDVLTKFRQYSLELS